MAHTAGISSRELTILGIISTAPTYGHQIMQIIRLSEADRWVELSEKHVYYVLRKLSREGWVAERTRRTGNTPPRKVYSITDAGRAALRRMLTADSLAEAHGYDPFDAALAMLAATSLLDGEESLEVLRRRLAALRRRAREGGLDTDLEEVHERFGGGVYTMAVKAQRLLYAEIEWLEEVIAWVESEGWDVMRVPARFLPGAAVDGDLPLPDGRERG